MKKMKKIEKLFGFYGEASLFISEPPKKSRTVTERMTRRMVNDGRYLYVVLTR